MNLKAYLQNYHFILPIIFNHFLHVFLMIILCFFCVFLNDF